MRLEWLCLPVALVLALLGGSVLPLVAGAVAVPLVSHAAAGQGARTGPGAAGR